MWAHYARESGRLWEDVEDTESAGGEGEDEGEGDNDRPLWGAGGRVFNIGKKWTEVEDLFLDFLCPTPYNRSMKNKKTVSARSSGKSMKALDDLLRELSYLQDSIYGDAWGSPTPVPDAEIKPRAVGLKKPSMRI